MSSTDITQILHTLQLENSSLKQENVTLRTQLTEVADECGVLEGEVDDSNARVAALSTAFIDTSRIYFSALKSLWDVISSSTSTTSGTTPRVTANMQTKAQIALTAALAQADRAQRVLVTAGMKDIAIAATMSIDSSTTTTTDSTTPTPSPKDALAIAAAAAMEDLRREEREIFTTAIKEVRDHATNLEKQLQDTQAQYQLLEADSNDLEDVVTELQARLQQQQQQQLVIRAEAEESKQLLQHQLSLAAAASISALTAAPSTIIPQTVPVPSSSSSSSSSSSLPLPPTPTHLLVDDEGDTIDASVVRTLKQTIAQLQSRNSELNRSLATAKQETATSARTAIANAAAEGTAYLQRALDAEARIEAAEKHASTLIRSHNREISEKQMKITTLENANAMLTRTAVSLRAEIDSLQDKYAAQGGLVDMLRREAADATARLSKLHANKVEMARSAARALREVEAQVETLSAAVVKANHHHHHHQLHQG